MASKVCKMKRCQTFLRLVRIVVLCNCMKKAPFSLLVVGLLIQVAACTSPEEPSPGEALAHNHRETTAIGHYTSADGQYEIAFPDSTLEHTETPISFEGRSFSIMATEYHANGHHGHSHGAEPENLLLRSDYVKLPWVRTEAQIDSLFAAQWTFVESLDQIHVEAGTTEHLDKWAASSGIVRVDGDDVITSYRMYFCRGILYKLLVITPSEQFPNKGILDFFDSFDVIQS